MTRSIRKPRARISLALAAAALLLVTTAPAPASASPDTLRRAFSNIFNGPFDIALSPIVAGLTLARNLEDVDDSTGVRVTYALPGYVWLTGLNFGSGTIRTLTGCLETIPGVLLFPFEADVDPLFDPVNDASGLYERDNPIADIENPWVYHNPVVAPFAIHVKFGINYTVADF